MLRLRFYRAGEEIRTALKFSSKDIRYFEKWAEGLSKLDFLDPLLARNARSTVERIKAYYRGDSMSDEKHKL